MWVDVPSRWRPFFNLMIFIHSSLLHFRFLSPRDRRSPLCFAANILFLVGSSLVMDRRQGDRSKSKRRANASTKLSKLFGSRSSQEKNSDGVDALQSAMKMFDFASECERKAAEMRRKGFNELARYAENSGNTAIHDVLSRSKEVYEVYTDRKHGHVDKYRSSVKHLKYIVDFDLEVAGKWEELSELKKSEQLLKEKIKRGEKGKGLLKKPRGGDILVWRRELADLQRQIAVCDCEHKAMKSEFEVCKMMKLRQVLKKMCDIDQDSAVDSQVTNECLREIAEQVPAVCTQDVHRMNYQSMPITKELVDQLKANLCSGAQRTHRRRSEPPRRQTPESPPPPYTPTAPPEPHVQRNHVSDSYLLRGERAVVFANEADYVVRPPPRTNVTPVRSGVRMYPELPANPYALQRPYNADA